MNSLDRPTILQRYRDRIENNERTKLTGDELQALVSSFIEQLKTLSTADEIQSLCIAEMALLEEGYSEATVSKQYVPPYRKAIRAAAQAGVLPMTEATSRRYTYTKRNSDETGEAHDHRALDFFKYSNQKYQEFAQVSAERNNTKQDSLQPVDPNQVIAKTIELLASSNPFEMAAGLAAATGRRFSEVVDKGSLTATTAPYWVQFAGQLKKSTEADDYLAPCLIPAADVLTALNRFRKHRRIARLAGQSPAQINRSLANSVKRTVKRHFQDTQIVPVLAGEAEVSIHNLRGIYGEIAVHYFCPPSQGTARFVQARLGHVISEEEFKRANATATQHYFHYYLVDEQGQHIGSKGVKLSVGGQPPAPIATAELTSDRTDEIMLEPIAIEPTEAPETIEVDEPIATPKTVEATKVPEPVASETEAVPEQLEPTARPEAVDQVNSTEAAEPVAIEAEAAVEQSEPTAATEAIAARLTEQIQSLSQTFNQEIQQLWHHINAMNIQTAAATDTSFFTREIESLRQQLEATQHDRDQAIEQLEAVRTDNAQLQERLTASQREQEQRIEAIEQGYRQRIEQLTAIIRDTPPAMPTPTSVAELAETPAKETTPAAPVVEQTAPPMSTPVSAQPAHQIAAPGSKPKRNTVPRSADKRVEAAMLAIMEWNRHHPKLEEKFAITQSLLQKSTGSNRDALKRVLKDFNDNIVAHHSEHGIEDQNRQNYGKNFDPILEFVGARL